MGIATRREGGRSVSLEADNQIFRVSKMGRVVVTSGGDRSRYKSKFKPIKKPIANSYSDVGGELVLSSNHAILSEKNLATGSFTGRKYELPIQNVKSNLPPQYKDLKCLNVVCRISSQKKEIQSIQKKKLKKEYSYIHRITHFYLVSLENESLEDNHKINSGKNNIVEAQDLNSEIISQSNIIKTDAPDEVVFEYVGKKEEYERIVADKLRSIIGGSREVLTPEGERVDLLTTDFLIEVKASSNWDDAIGQILKYKIYFPKHELIIFIFGNDLDVKTAKERLMQVINSFVSIPIHIVTSVKELISLVCKV